MGPWASLQSFPCLHFLLHIRKVARLPITWLLRGAVGWERSAQCVADSKRSIKMLVFIIATIVLPDAFWVV